MTYIAPIKRDLVVVESPYSAPDDETLWRNIQYARAAMTHCAEIGEAPFAGHLLYTQILEDKIQEQRDEGIACHINWIRAATSVAIYKDFGISEGMEMAIEAASALRVPVEFRSIPDWKSYVWKGDPGWSGACIFTRCNECDYSFCTCPCHNKGE